MATTKRTEPKVVVARESFRAGQRFVRKGDVLEATDEVVKKHPSLFQTPNEVFRNRG